MKSKIMFMIFALVTTSAAQSFAADAPVSGGNNDNLRQGPACRYLKMAVGVVCVDAFAAGAATTFAVGLATTKVPAAVVGLSVGVGVCSATVGVTTGCACVFCYRAVKSFEPQRRLVPGVQAIIPQQVMGNVPAPSESVLQKAAVSASLPQTELK